MERQVKLRIAAGKQFCVLLFDIDDSGSSTDVGHEAGRQVLKQVGERLNTQIRARDVACRWLADEFIVLLECDMENARRRCAQMSQCLRGPYTIEEEGRPAKLEIRCVGGGYGMRAGRYSAEDLAAAGRRLPDAEQPGRA